MELQVYSTLAQEVERYAYIEAIIYNYYANNIQSHVLT